MSSIPGAFLKLTIFPFCSSTHGGKEKKEKNIAVNIMLIKSFKKAIRIIAMMIIVTMMMIIVMATLMMMTIRLDGERGSKGEK